MWYWVVLSYFDGKVNKMQYALHGPYNSEQEAETEALRELGSLPSADYKIHVLDTRDRNKARGLIKDLDVKGGVPLPDVMHTRYHRTVRK